MTVVKNNGDARYAVAIALQTAMAELKMRPSDLGKLMHVTTNRARSWIDEGLTPRSEYFQPLCEEFGFDPDEFGFEIIRDEDLAPMAPVEFGRIFASARMKQQLTIQFVARWSGVHYITLSRIERGIALPQEATVKRLCDVLGLDEAEMQKKRLCALKGAQKKCR